MQDQTPKGLGSGQDAAVVGRREPDGGSQSTASCTDGNPKERARALRVAEQCDSSDRPTATPPLPYTSPVPFTIDHGPSRPEADTTSSEASRTNSLTAVFDQAVVSGTNFLTGLLIARTCTKGNYGLYVLGFSLVTTGIALQHCLITSPYIALSPRLGALKRMRYLGSSLILQFAFSVSCVLGLALLALGTKVRLENNLVTTMILIGCLPAILLKEYARQVYFAKLLVFRALVLDSSASLFQLASLLILAQKKELTPATALAAMAWSCGICTCAWLFINNDIFAFSTKETTFHARQSLAFGKWLVGSTVLTLLTTQSYFWSLLYFHGATSTAVLAACSAVIGIAQPITFGISNFMASWIAHLSTDAEKDAHRFVLRSTLGLAGILVAYSMFCLFCGEQLVSGLYGESYSGNRYVVFFLSISFLLANSPLYIVHFLNARNYPQVNFMANIVASVLTMAVGILLAKVLGCLGASLGLLASNGAAFVVLLLGFRRLRNDPSARCAQCT